MNSIIREAKFKQPKLLNHFMKVVKAHRLTHAYLFSGKNGVGKLATALTITMRLFCLHPKAGYPCGECNECSRISNLENPHPDVTVIKPQGQTIRISQIRFLKSEFSKSAVEGDLKVFIIVDAEKMTEGAANSLLKFIEEPVGNVASFLLTTNKSKILPTVISRTQVVEFPSLAPQLFFKELKRIHVNPDSYRLMFAMTNDLKLAKFWNQDRWFVSLQMVVSQWFHLVISHRPEAFPLIQVRLLPLIKQPQDRTVVINMLIQIWCDVMKFKFGSISRRQLKFPGSFSDVRVTAKAISTSKLLKIVELLLANNRLLTLNVSFQNILERTTLKILRILN